MNYLPYFGNMFKVNSHELIQWEKVARVMLQCHFNSSEELDRFLVEMRENPAATFMSYDQLAELTMWKMMYLDLLKGAVVKSGAGVDQEVRTART